MMPETQNRTVQEIEDCSEERDESEESPINYNNCIETTPKKDQKLLCSDDGDTSSQYTTNRKGILAQCIVSSLVLMLNLGTGMPVAYSAILLPQLAESNNTFDVDESMGSWIASIHSLASPLGALVSGPMVDAMGRRSCLQLSAIPLCLGWLLIGFASNIVWIFFGRFSTGFAVGMSTVASQIFLGEVTDAKIRACIATIATTAYCGGILFVYVLGSITTWQNVAFYALILPAIGVISLTTVSESPAWLIRKGKITAAQSALMKLRGNNIKQVTAEMSLLEARAKEDLSRKSSSMTLRERVLETRAKVLHPGALKPLLIINVFFILHIYSGTYVVVSYGVDLVRYIGRESINSYTTGIITGVIRFFFCLVSSFLLLRMGRRTIAITSAIGTTVSSLALGIFLLSKVENRHVDEYVISICLITYISLNTIGLLTLPGMMIGELLPHRVRGVGGGFTMFVFHLSLFLTTKVFPMVKNMTGIGGVFIIFGISAVFETIFTWLVLPETRNRTLEEIEDYFKEENVLWKNRKNLKNHKLSASES